MILDNLLRTINAYMSEMFTTFGGASQEYMTALRQIRENLPDALIHKAIRQGLDYIGINPTKPLQFSRSKAVLDMLENFGTEILEIRKEQRETGTAKTQAQKYYDEQKLINPDKPVSIEELKRQVDERTYFNNNVNDWYKAIDNSVILSEDEKQSIKYGAVSYQDLHENYWDANYRHDLQERAKALIEKAKQRTKAGHTVGPQPKSMQGVGADLNKIIK